jgi:hypothetical protein
MSADLTYSGWMTRGSLVLQDDALVVLEHQVIRDRVKRIKYDRVSTLLIWREFPVGRAVLFLVLFGLPGISSLTTGGGGIVTGSILLAVLAIIEIRYALYQKTHILIQRGERTYRYSGIFSRKKVNRFAERFASAARRSQTHSNPPQPSETTTESVSSSSPTDPLAS